MQNEATDQYLLAFETFEKTLNGRSNTPLHALRKEAIARFADLGFPTTRDEAWTHTSVASLARATFHTATDRETSRTLDIENPIQNLDGTCLVFINGFYSAEQSNPGNLPKGVQAGNLADLPAAQPKWVENHLAKHAAYQDHTFIALNTAFLQDGAFVYIPKGTVVESPIHLLFLSSSTGEATISHPRTLIVAEENSQATLIETYTGTGVYFTNAVTEVIAGDNAVVDHYKLELESPEAFHIATLQTQQGKSSNLSTHTISLGGKLVRNEVNALIAGEGGETTVNGFYLTNKEQHIDNYTLLEHAEPNCNSHELYKGILGDKSSGVFRGKIHVHQKAQKTDAFQSNQNLLISDNADINTKPQLEIYADDVKCSHGATIGQLDPDAIFYLRSRGVNFETAQQILAHAFAADILDRIKVAPIKDHLERLVMEKFEQTRNPETQP